MTNWRPKGWESKRFQLLKRQGGYFNEATPIIVKQDIDIFEAGANAMLEALKKEGVKVTLTNGVLGLVEPQYAMAMLTKGKLVFIPDD